MAISPIKTTNYALVNSIFCVTVGIRLLFATHPVGGAGTVDLMIQPCMQMIQNITVSTMRN